MLLESMPESELKCLPQDLSLTNFIVTKDDKLKFFDFTAVQKTNFDSNCYTHAPEDWTALIKKQKIKLTKLKVSWKVGIF